jgi:hypothetical protein
MGKSTEELMRELQAGGVLSGSDLAPIAASPPSPPPVGRARQGLKASVLLIVAALLAAVIGSLPIIDLAVYPFALFVTLLHETGHSVAAELTGGSVGSLTIRSNLSGVIFAYGGITALIAPAGYLGASLASVLVLLPKIRFARFVIGSLAVVPAADLLFFHPADLFTGAACVAFLLALALAAWKLKNSWLAFLQIFLGVEAGLNAFRDLTTLILLSGSGREMGTDADQMAQAFVLPSLFWAVLWTILSVVILAAAAYVVVRRDLRDWRGQ